MRYLCPLLLLSCQTGDKGVMVFDNAPSASILSPQDYAVYDEGETITFQGVIDDDGPFEDLTIQWTSSIQGELPALDPPDDEGYLTFSTASLVPGNHIITLRAIDDGAQQGEDEINVFIEAVPEIPSVQILHPTSGEMSLAEMPYVFMGQVSDEQDLPTELVVEVSSSPGGFICFASVDGIGFAQCTHTLPLGTYMIKFRVLDTDGNESVSEAVFQVVSQGDFDADGDGYSPNGGDCKDQNATIYPGAPELCDGLDNDCNELTPIDVGSECYDDDNDGYCEAPPCLNADSMLPDCDDTLPQTSPEAQEVPNGYDDDCDGLIDEGTVNFDDDGDGYCEAPPCLNATSLEPDCDDTNYLINPAAVEICGDGVDNNCNGTTNEENAQGCRQFYYDGDGDSFGVSGMGSQCWCDGGSYPYTGLDTTDCYDTNADVHPLQTQFFPAHRGDGSFDYNCSYSEEREYTAISGGCQWGFVSGLSCSTNSSGWENTLPTCGQSGLWVGDCDAQYDVVCFGACMIFSSDWLYCLLQYCSNSQCNPEYDSRTQGCR